MRNISITGFIGAGKSSICKELEKIGYKTISAGKLFREYANEHDMKLEDVVQGHPEIDKIIDSNIEKINKTENNVIFDSRLAWNFASDSFKVFMYVNPDVAAKRIFDEKRKGESFDSIEECKHSIISRQLKEKENYINLYNKNYLDMKNYDLVIDATYATPDQISKKILEGIEHPIAKYQLSPKSLYPTQSIRDLSESRLEEYRTGELKSMPISINIDDKTGLFKIIDGHHRFLATALNDVNGFISAEITEAKNIPIVPKSSIYDYEDVGKFFYDKYPDAENNIVILEKENIDTDIDIDR